MLWRPPDETSGSRAATYANRVAKLHRTESKSNTWKSFFPRHSIPDIVMSTLRSGDVHTFADKYGFILMTSSPKYPQYNGEAERAVQTLNILSWKNEDPYVALLAYRYAALANSPAQLLVGRQLHSTVRSEA